MRIRTHYLPAERLTLPEILDQARRACREPSVLMAMLDCSSDMIALLNPEQQIVFCNEACAKAGGLEDKDYVLGMRPGELLRCVHATDRPGGCGSSDSCRYCGLAQALVTGQQGFSKSGEYLLQCHDPNRGISAEYAVQVRPVPQLGDGWQCYSLSDISGEKRRETLERIFFHDILNLASAVESVSMALAGEDVSAEERAEFVGMLSVSARALVEEISSQRTLLAAEAGELTVGSIDCDSLHLLQKAVATCQAFGIAENKHVTILPDAQSIHFWTDDALLGRILINMIKNALEASGPNASVTVTCTLSAPGRLCFYVHNDTAIPDSIRAEVFQRSFTTKGTGRGMGTYSVKLLTENYLGGRVWFDSVVDQGTTFHAEFAI